MVEAGLGDQLPKLATIPLFGVFIAWYQNTSAAAWIYLAMHGTYGVVWVIKDLTFPDPSFHKRITMVLASPAFSACSAGTGYSVGC